MPFMLASYPEGRIERDRWIVALRPPRNDVDPQKPYSFVLEEERTEKAEVVPVATIFLTNRECPWRCVMCDLWRNTLTTPVEPGAIPAQIDYALSRLPAARRIKLYNAGSFFDHGAIPKSDYSSIAGRLSSFEQVIVESHPALVGKDCLQFSDLLDGRLQVAMGLETVHPDVLPKLNKEMTLKQFSDAANLLRGNEISVRVFVLLQPPFLQVSESVSWAVKSIQFAFDCGASVAVLIPTRAGNGALEEFTKFRKFSQPDLSLIETAFSEALTLNRGFVFLDLWDLHRFATCTQCFDLRLKRFHQMNLQQAILPAVACERCNNNFG